MNNNVSFEIAKLIKEKGFKYQYEWNPSFDNLPTISEIVMWIYEKHNIWIIVDYWFNQSLFETQKPFQWKINDIISSDNFKTPTEAYESVIQYILINLI